MVFVLRKGDDACAGSPTRTQSSQATRMWTRATCWSFHNHMFLQEEARCHRLWFHRHRCWCCCWCCCFHWDLQHKHSAGRFGLLGRDNRLHTFHSFHFVPLHKFRCHSLQGDRHIDCSSKHDRHHTCSQPGKFHSLPTCLVRTFRCHRRC